MAKNDIGLCWCEACADARRLSERKFAGPTTTTYLLPPSRTGKIRVPRNYTSTAPSNRQPAVAHVAGPMPAAVAKPAPLVTPKPVVTKPPPAPTVKSQLTGIINGMTPQERSGFTTGYAKAQASGFLGSQESYLSQQASLLGNKRTQPGDPKVTSQLSAGTLAKYSTLRSAQSSAPTAGVKPTAAGKPGPAAPGPTVPVAHAKPLPPPKPYAMPKPIQLPHPVAPKVSSVPKTAPKAPSMPSTPSLPSVPKIPSAGPSPGGGNSGEPRDTGGEWTQASDSASNPPHRVKSPKGSAPAPPGGIAPVGAGAGYSMAKDAKGHGSDKRGNSGAATMEKIAKRYDKLAADAHAANRHEYAARHEQKAAQFRRNAALSRAKNAKPSAINSMGPLSPDATPQERYDAQTRGNLAGQQSGRISGPGVAPPEGKFK